MSGTAPIEDPKQHNRSFFGNKFSTGTFTKIYVLHLLVKNNRAMYAAEIKQDMINTLEWGPSDGLLLQVLQGLTESKYVERWWEHGRATHGKRYYRITEEGYEYFQFIANNNKQAFRVSKRIIDAAIKEVYNGKV